MGETDERALFRAAALAHRGQTEAIDRRLCVSSPYERHIAAWLVVVAVVVAAWLLLGSAERSVTAPCLLRESGDGRQMSALMWVPAGEADQISVGLAVTVASARRDGGSAASESVGRAVFDGAVSVVGPSRAAPPAWLHDAVGASFGNGRVVTADIGPQTDAMFGVGRDVACHARIVLSADQPVGLLLLTASRTAW